MSRLIALVFLALVSQVKLEEHADGPTGTLQEIRKKWGARELVRDLDHIKEDVRKMTKLQELGEIKTDEVIFYFFRNTEIIDYIDDFNTSEAIEYNICNDFRSTGCHITIRMHDFDDNNKLDGLELSIAMKHTMEHSDNPTSISDVDLTSAIDSFLDNDENKDGYLTYAEIRKFTASEGQ